jgi:hypothetical protein
MPKKCEVLSSNPNLVCFDYLVPSLGAHMGSNTCLSRGGVFNPIIDCYFEPVCYITYLCVLFER